MAEPFTAMGDYTGGEDTLPPVDGTVALEAQLKKPPVPVPDVGLLNRDPLNTITESRDQTTWQEKYGFTISPDAPTLDESRRFKGVDTTVIPSFKDIEALRANQNEPLIGEAFDDKYQTPGLHKQFLSVPDKDHIEYLVRFKQNPEVRKEFDDIYGGVSKPWIELMDPETPPQRRKLAAIALSQIYSSGFDMKTKMEYGSVGEFTRAMGEGGVKAIQELGQSIGVVDEDFQKLNTIPRDNPLTSGLAEGLTQFATGRLILGTVFGRLNVSKDLSSLRFLREMGIEGLVNAFAFDPNDPLIGDAIKQFGLDTNEFTKFIAEVDSIDYYDTDATKRIARAAENTAVGGVMLGVLKTIGFGYRTVKAYRQGKMEAAEAAKEAAAKEAENLAKAEAEAAAKAAEEAARRPATQLELPVDTPQQGSLDLFPEPGLPPQSPPRPVPILTLDDLKRRVGATQQQFELGLEPRTKSQEWLDNNLPGAQRSFDFPERELPKKPSDVPDAAVVNKKAPEVTLDAIVEPEVRKVREIVDPPSPIKSTDPIGDMSDPLRRLIDSVGDFANRTLAEARAKVSPFVDELSKLTRQEFENVTTVLSDKFSVNDFKKIHALFNETQRKTKEQIAALEAQVKRLLKANEGAIADSIINGELKDLKAFNEKLSLVVKPLGSAASDMLNIHKIKYMVGQDPAIRAKVDKLIDGGLTYEQVGKVLDLEAEGITVSTEKLKQAQARYEAASISNNPKELKKATRLLRKAEDELMEARASGLKEKWDAALNALVELSLNAKLAGVKTWLVVQPVGVATNMVLRWGFENLGYAAMGDFKAIARTNLAQMMAFRVQNKTATRTLMEFAKDSFLKAAQDKPLITKGPLVGEAGMGADWVPGISSENLGKLVPEAVKNAPLIGADTAVGRSLATAVDAAGHVTRLPSKAMGFSDNMFGKMAAHIEVAADASAWFHTEVAERMTTLKQILKDEKLPAARKAEIEAELAALNKEPTITIDGKTLNEKQWIEEKVVRAFDEEGHIVDPVIAKKVDEVLMKDAFEGKVMSSVEAVAGSNLARLFLSPFVRQPLRGLQRGLELIPLVSLAQQQFRADIQGLNGSRRQAIALGKGLFGTALTTWAISKIIDGDYTGSGPANYAQRAEWIASGVWRPGHLRIGDNWYDISALDLIKVPLDMIYGIYHGLEQADIKTTGFETQAEHISSIAGIIAASVAMSIVDKPVFTDIKNIAEGFSEMEKSAEYEPSTAMKLERAAGRWTTGFVPNFLNHLNNVIDPSITRPLTFAQHWARAFGDKNGVSHAYSLTGTPLELLAPTQGFYGIFASVNEKTMTPQMQADIRLANLGRLTGQRFAMQPVAPGADMKNINLMQIPSASGKGTLWDQFYKEFGTIEIQGRTFAETVNDMFKGREEADANGLKRMAIGSFQKDGQFADTIKSIHSLYREAAWTVVKQRELQAGNTELNLKIGQNQIIQRNAQDSSKDKVGISPIPVFAK